jgi:hypothetical protein
VDRQADKASHAGSSWMSLVVSCAVLAMVVAPTALIFAWINGRQLSGESLIAAAIGGGVCWLAASLALAAGYYGNRFQAPVQGVLLGMLFRLGLPLAAIAILPRLGEAWVPPGVAMTILGVYLVALVVETGLALRMVPRQSRIARAA